LSREREPPLRSWLAIVEVSWARCIAPTKVDQAPNWNNLLVFWSPGPILSITEINPHFWLRDGVLGPYHNAAPEAPLKPLNRQ